MILSICVLPHKDKIDSSNEAEEGGEVVPMQAFVLEHEMCKDCEYNEGDTLLDYFQLHKGKGASVSNKADAVCRHLAAILKESYEPRERYYANQWPVG